MGMLELKLEWLQCCLSFDSWFSSISLTIPHERGCRCISPVVQYHAFLATHGARDRGAKRTLKMPFILLPAGVFRRGADPWSKCLVWRRGSVEYSHCLDHALKCHLGPVWQFRAQNGGGGLLTNTLTIAPNGVWTFHKSAMRDNSFKDGFFISKNVPAV